MRTSGGDDNSVLQVVCSQRDRFKARNQEIESVRERPRSCSSQRVSSHS